MTDQDRTCGRVQPHPRHKYLLDRASQQCPGVPDSSVEVYFCPTSGEIEPTTGGGFDVCCAHPELHAYLGYRTPGIDAISTWLSERAKKEHKVEQDMVDRVTNAVARNYLDDVGLTEEPLPDPSHPFWVGWRRDAEAAIAAVRRAQKEMQP